MRPTIENAKQLEEAQKFRVGPTIERAKNQQEYIDSLQQQFGVLEPYEESLREKTVGALMNLGMPRNRAQGFIGNLSSDTILDSMGLIDFTPLALPFIFDEAKRGFAKAEKPTDYIAPIVEAGLGVIEAYPVTKVATRPLRLFLSNLGKKTSAPTDTSRRALLKGAIAAPVTAGALSQIPLGRVVDEVVPVAKETAPVIKKVESIVRLTDLPQMQKVLVKGNIIDGQIDFDDISKTLDRKVESIDDLNEKELNIIYEDIFFADGKPTDLFEEEIAEELSDGLDISKLKEINPEGEFGDFPQVELYENFRKEMKLSGYSDKQIDEVITNIMLTEN